MVEQITEIERLEEGLAKQSLISHKSNIQDEDIRKNALEQWKVCVQMAQNTSQRRANTNGLFITINTATIGYIYYQYKDKVVLPFQSLWAIVGLMLCIFWISSILYYKELNKTKYNIIKELEEYIGVCPFICESYASPKKASWHIELEIPSMFAVGYVTYGIVVEMTQLINNTSTLEKTINGLLIIGMVGLGRAVFCQRLECKK